VSAGEFFCFVRRVRLLAALPALFALVVAGPAYAQALNHFTSSTTRLAFD